MKILPSLLAAASLLSAAEIKLGKPLTLKEPMTLAALLAKPADYVGKTVQVKGKVVEVCQVNGLLDGPDERPGPEDPDQSERWRDRVSQGCAGQDGRGRGQAEQDWS